MRIIEPVKGVVEYEVKKITEGSDGRKISEWTEGDGAKYRLKDERNNWF